MSKWTYQGSIMSEVPEGVYGFIYRISWGGNYYIGSKSFWSITNPKISKKRANELYTGRGAKKKREQKVKESDWRTYKSSSKEVKALVESIGEERFVWEILDFAESKSDLSYKETQYILCNDCLRDKNCWNGWVTCKIHKNNL